MCVQEYYSIIFPLLLFASSVGIVLAQAPTPPDQENAPQHICVELTARFATVDGIDGVRKEVITINDQFPGPTLRAKLGDKMTVKLRNELRDSAGREYKTSLHFHGIEMKETPWWDGPELVTQCPIQYGGHMEYSFNLHQVGTYWWHSHTSWQYIDGFWGFLIVDSNVTEVHAYDDELDISLMDWHHLGGEELTQVFHLPNTSTIPRAAQTPVPDSALINGRGNANCTAARLRNLTCSDAISNLATVFNVAPGLTYRVRVLNPSARASFNFSIDGHKLRVIETDGVDTVEVEPVDVVEIWPAQRYSFLVTMNSTENLGFYRIRADMVLEREILSPEDFQRISGLRALAAVRYSRVLSNEIEIPFQPHSSRGGGSQGRPSCRTMPWEDQLVAWAKDRIAKMPEQVVTCNTPTDNLDPSQILVDASQIPDLSRRTPNPVYLDQMKATPVGSKCEWDSAPDWVDQEVVLTARFNENSLGFLRWSFGSEVYDTEKQHVPAIFNVLGAKTLPRPFGARYVPLKRAIQIVINNDNPGAHPYHLHGHTFWVMATGNKREGNYSASRDAVKVQAGTPIKRDTTHTHPNSWTVVRYFTDNPGTWLLHCHIHWHLDRGLGAVFVEGEEEVPCRYKVPPEARRVCEASGVLIPMGMEKCSRDNDFMEFPEGTPFLPKTTPPTTWTEPPTPRPGAPDNPWTARPVPWTTPPTSGNPWTARPAPWTTPPTSGNPWTARPVPWTTPQTRRTPVPGNNPWPARPVPWTTQPPAWTPVPPTPPARTTSSWWRPWQTSQPKYPTSTFTPTQNWQGFQNFPNHPPSPSDLNNHHPQLEQVPGEIYHQPGGFWKDINRPFNKQFFHYWVPQVPLGWHGHHHVPLYHGGGYLPHQPPLIHPLLYPFGFPPEPQPEPEPEPFYFGR